MVGPKTEPEDEDWAGGTVRNRWLTTRSCFLVLALRSAG